MNSFRPQSVFKFIHEENISRFEKMLEETDDARRQDLLQKLICSEKTALAREDRSEMTSESEAPLDGPVAGRSGKTSDETAHEA